MAGIKDLAIVVVLYKLGIKESITLNSLSRIVDQKKYDLDVIIYDNSPNAQTVPLDYNLNISYIHDPSNPGISKAYNFAAQHAFKQGKSWLLFFDHDTELTIDTIDIYIKAIDEHPFIEVKVPLLKLASSKIFSPSKFILNRSTMLPTIVSGIYSFKGLTFVNSGMLVSAALFKKAGGYNEKVKLDHSDTEFIKRIKRITNKFQLIDLTLKHDFSNDKTDFDSAKHRFLFFLHDTKNCTTNGLIDKFSLNLVCLAYTLSLCKKYRKAIFFNMFIREYVL